MFKDFGLQMGSLLEIILQIWHEKKGAEIEARKMMTFVSFLGGAGGRGGACLSLQNLQNLHPDLARPAPPAGVRRILRLRPCRRPAC